MINETLKNNLPYLNAYYLEERPIQLFANGTWQDYDHDWLITSFELYNFRFKPREPKSVWILRLKNGGYVKYNKGDRYYKTIDAADDYAELAGLDAEPVEFREVIKDEH